MRRGLCWGGHSKLRRRSRRRQLCGMLCRLLNSRLGGIYGAGEQYVSKDLLARALEGMVFSMGWNALFELTYPDAA